MLQKPLKPEHREMIVVKFFSPMRIFVLGTGATGSYLAHLLTRQGHQKVTCGDRDLDRARRFLGKKSTIPVVQVNARNMWGIVRAAKGSQLLVNAKAPLSSTGNQVFCGRRCGFAATTWTSSAHLMRNPFKAEQLRFDKRFKQKNRAALITAGAAPGMTNLMVARASSLMDSVEWGLHPALRKHGERGSDFTVVRGSIFRRGHIASSHRSRRPIPIWKTFRRA